MKSLLEVQGLNKHFGGLRAISDLDFNLQAGELRGLIGPNGSGKSTFFNLISGVYTPSSGSVFFDGHDISRAKPHRIASLGMSRTFQLLRIFGEMTVLDNLMVGHHLHVKYSPLQAVFSTAKVAAEEQRMRDEMLELLQFIGLSEFAEIPAAEISVGQRRLLALGRAIAMRPKLLLLDEPAAGLSPVNVDKIMAIILALKDRYQLTVIVVEHILKVVMNTCETVTVLDHGQKIAEGPPDQVKDDPAVVEAYLGREMDDDEVRSVLQGESA